MNEAYLSLGSNMGDKEEALRQAVYLLNAHSDIEVLAVSSIYDTDPVGYEEQDVFLNIVVHVQTTLLAQSLLEVCQQIEQQLKRVRIVRWGPRTIDLDILLFNNDNIESNTLIVPHPRMHERAFVLVPLEEIAATLQVPTFQQTVAQLLQQVGHEGVRVYKETTSIEAFLLENE